MPAAPPGSTPPAPPRPPGVKKSEPDHIQIDHILIGVENLRASPGQFNGKWAAPKAKDIAYDLLARLKAGGDWDAAKKQFSEDPPPGGPYSMANFGAKPNAADEIPRQKMVPGFGNVGFQLDVGEIGIADFDARTSPYGYHIIKRLK